MHEANKKRLKEPHLVQLFDRYATYNGSTPYKAPGILNLIPTLEHIEGSYFPVGGMYQITDALVNLAKDLGVEFHYNEIVDEIITIDGRATGVQTEKRTLESDVVVSNMDVFFTYQKLLRGITIPKRIIDQERSSSAIVFYWGVKRSFDELGLHNIFFSNNYQEEFNYLFEKGDIYNDPTVYINITSKLNSSDAPNGCENWFVMVNAPYNNQQDWPHIIECTRQNVISKLNRMLDIDLSDLIECEQITEPLLIEQKTNSYKGSLYGTSSNSKMAAFFRHPNFNRKIKNLFFCGGSVHPGGGIPLCLMSAKIVDSLI